MIDIENESADSLDHLHTKMERYRQNRGSLSHVDLKMKSLDMKLLKYKNNISENLSVNFDKKYKIQKDLEEKLKNQKMKKADKKIEIEKKLKYKSPYSQSALKYIGVKSDKMPQIKPYVEEPEIKKS